MTTKKWIFQFSENARADFLDLPKGDRIRIETKLFHHKTRQTRWVISLFATKPNVA
jgi:hypothetical protein